MTELRFHREIYEGNSVDEAVKRFAAYGSFELAEEPQHWVVKLTCQSAAREAAVAGELGNCALGLTIQNRGAPP